MIIHLIVGLIKNKSLYKISYYQKTGRRIKNKIKLNLICLIMQQNLA